MESELFYNNSSHMVSPSPWPFIAGFYLTLEVIHILMDIMFCINGNCWFLSSNSGFSGVSCSLCGEFSELCQWSVYGFISKIYVSVNDDNSYSL